MPRPGTVNPWPGQPFGLRWCGLQSMMERMDESLAQHPCRLPQVASITASATFGHSE
jgi:hypothetical protein